MLVGVVEELIQIQALGLQAVLVAAVLGVLGVMELLEFMQLVVEVEVQKEMMMLLEEMVVLES